MHKRVILACPQNEVHLLKMSTKSFVLRPIIIHYRTEYNSLNSNDFPLYIYTFGTLSKAGVEISVATKEILFPMLSISLAREIIIHPVPVPISNTLE